MGERRSDGGAAKGRGATSISDTVVSKIAGIAAQEVEKVQMGGGTAAAVGGFLTSVTGAVTGGNSTGGASLTSGVSVEVGQEEAAVDLTVAVEYGVSIPQTTQAIRDNVINRVENLTGLRVTEVNITVNDVQFPEERPQLGRQQEVERQAQEEERRSQGPVSGT
ncbi:MAG: Asp23/Gls24 family envelope stress response protein [Rubrobacter sp.]|nr:Asp23/Gls24 family envelope stress response protein [Rubrobacter sp.]MDQ3637168.1 Asp23/Gls24 family envelope stress response protein [Actinomycetota bacterium]